eukprot:jgi/Hompol1/2841/HPOL_006185-RA
MKIHSFFRTHLPTGNVPAQDVYAARHDGPKLSDVGFSHYVYFLFCPSLLYRTQYPLTPMIRWSKVMIHAIECFLLVIYIYILFERFLFPILRVPPVPEQDNLREFGIMAFNCMLPSMMIFVFGFFGFLHCWLNMHAELLRFADREFYRDWWNSHSFAEYYRKWNGVVYDWLFEYVYAELFGLLTRRGYAPQTSRAVAALFVIEASAIIHEFIIACAFGFFFPVLLLMFGGPGVIFTHFTRKQKNQNIFVWAMLFVGCGLLVTLYSREFYFRQLHLEDLAFQSPGYWNHFFTSYVWDHLLKIRIARMN